jgi:ornithine cyclodeaminase/alanine dehydrogenase-like protein (mu-crystallin family)
MTLATLAQTIKRLPADEQAKLFDKLGSALEDYLLGKIAVDRFQKASDKRVSWEELKP